MTLIDLTGQRFERLTVLERAERRGNRGTYWRCSCSCGGEVIAWANNLRRGNTRSCGCLQREAASRLSRIAEPDYDALHQRLKLERGRASDEVCISCGQNAEDWSWNGTVTESTRWTSRGYGYSLDVNDYSARCKPCHSSYDAGVRAGVRLAFEPHLKAAEELGLTQDQYRLLTGQGVEMSQSVALGWVPVFDPATLERVGVENAAPLGVAELLPGPPQNIGDSPKGETR